MSKKLDEMIEKMADRYAMEIIGIFPHTTADRDELEREFQSVFTSKAGKQILRYVAEESANNIILEYDTTTGEYRYPRLKVGWGEKFIGGENESL